MIVEIDQSGKSEQLNTTTAVAYSDSESGVIWIRAAVKRKIATRLRKRFKHKSQLWPITFAIVVFILIADLTPDAVLLIDEEYTGKDRLIAERIADLLTRKYSDRWRGSIRFGRIGCQ